MIAAGTHFLWFLLIPIGWVLLHTGITYKCPITHHLHRQTQAAQENLLVHFLPKYNPQPVFIFKADNQLAYANNPAKQLFPELKLLQELITADTQLMIKEERIQHFTLTLKSIH